MPNSSRKAKKKKTKITRTDPAQSAKFLKAVKELGLDENAGEEFERAMDSLTKRKKSSSNQI